MGKRFISIWFHHLITDWFILRRPELREVPFVFTAPEHNRILITAANQVAETEGIYVGMPVADAKAIVPHLQVFEDKPGRNSKLIKALGEWCIRYSPIVATDHANGLILDATGCTHLLGTEDDYLIVIANRLYNKGYSVNAAMANTIGAAWAVCHYGHNGAIINPGEQAKALMCLPPSALRLGADNITRLQKLGLSTIGSFIKMPRSVLRRRFGEDLLLRLGQALGIEDEVIQPLQIIQPYEERLPCLEPVRTATAIEIAIQRLLEQLCKRLAAEGKGLRTAVLKCYRIDGKTVQVNIGTNKPANQAAHLFKLFQLKIADIAPALGIELFTLEAANVEDVEIAQESLWGITTGLEDPNVAELLDRIAGKAGKDTIKRYLPQEHYWPERSVKSTETITDKPVTTWQVYKPRPTHLLAYPERIEVTAPIPDYPPMLFRYKDKIHHIKKSDGPERIEREWWIDKGEHRDYYVVEDEAGCRYWLFRSGHYDAGNSQQWFLHGFFA